jgi:hypothetical protein
MILPTTAIAIQMQMWILILPAHKIRVNSLPILFSVLLLKKEYIISIIIWINKLLTLMRCFL